MQLPASGGSVELASGDRRVRAQQPGQNGGPSTFAGQRSEVPGDHRGCPSRPASGDDAGLLWRECEDPGPCQVLPARAIVSALANLAVPDPDPEFRANLRVQLVAITRWHGDMRRPGLPVEQHKSRKDTTDPRGHHGRG